MPEKKKKRKFITKRRILLLVLLLPTLIALGFLAVMGVKFGAAKIFAKNWLKINEPDSVLLEVHHSTLTANGVKTRSIDCVCLDGITGVIYQQTFDRIEGEWVPSQNAVRSHNSMLAGYMGYMHLAELLTEAELPVTAVYYPETGGYSSAGCLLFTADAEPGSLPALWEQIAKIIEAEPTVSTRLIACPKALCDKLLAADSIRYRKKYYDPDLVGSVPELGMMIGKNTERLYSCLLTTGSDIGNKTKVQFSDSPAHAVETILKEAAVDADALWEINSESVSAYRFK